MSFFLCCWSQVLRDLGPLWFPPRACPDASGLDAAPLSNFKGSLVKVRSQIDAFQTLQMSFRVSLATRHQSKFSVWWHVSHRPKTSRKIASLMALILYGGCHPEAVLVVARADVFFFVLLESSSQGSGPAMVPAQGVPRCFRPRRCPTL